MLSLFSLLVLVLLLLLTLELEMKMKIMTCSLKRRAARLGAERTVFF